jgi:hypothetical protein
VASLAPFFDFTVSAEEAAVALPKPHAAPFEVAPYWISRTLLEIWNPC